MGHVEKTLSLQSLANWLLARRAAIFILLAMMAPPSWPFVKGAAQGIAQIGSASAEEATELFKIYALVRSARRDTDDGWAWQIAKTVLDESKRYAMDPLLVLAVIGVESDFNETAMSVKGAKGLMQLRPLAAKASAEERRSSWGDKPIPNTPPLYDPVLNIKLGISYLDSLQRSFGDTKLALAAYNHGPTWIKSRLAEEQYVPLGYAKRVLSTHQRYRQDTRQAD
jgi:soluble lytic murein transglycosylase-like protein